jgi:hypothetical protein
MTGLKGWLADFPGQNGGVVTALVLIFGTGVNVNVRFARGLPFPDGYEPFLWVLLALAGVNVVGMVGKRYTDIGYKQAGQPTVTAEGPSTVNVTAAAPAAGVVGAAPAPAQPVTVPDLAKIPASEKGP